MRTMVLLFSMSFKRHMKKDYVEINVFFLQTEIWFYGHEICSRAFSVITTKAHWLDYLDFLPVFFFFFS